MSANSAKKHFADKLKRAADKALSLKRGVTVVPMDALPPESAPVPATPTAASEEKAAPPPASIQFSTIVGLATGALASMNPLGRPAAVMPTATQTPPPRQPSPTDADEKLSNLSSQIASYSAAALQVAAQTDESWSSPKEAALAEARAARLSASALSSGRRDSRTSSVGEASGGLKALPTVSPAERVLRKAPSKVHAMADIQMLGSPERELMTGGGVGSPTNDSDAASASAASVRSDGSKSAAGPRSIQAAISAASESQEGASSSMCPEGASLSSAAASQDAAADDSSASDGTKSQRRKASRKRRTESATRSGKAFGDTPPHSPALGSPAPDAGGASGAPRGAPTE